MRNPCRGLLRDETGPLDEVGGGTAGPSPIDDGAHPWPPPSRLTCSVVAPMNPTALDPLPIDPLLAELVATALVERRLVVEAPPGAGKTTRLPWALMEALGPGAGEVLVSEPRRLAARLAARRVATERGQRLGETVGYQVRFEDISSPRTRLRYLTDGVLLRRLAGDPRLEGVGAVVLDELHERRLPSDVALALIRRCLDRARPDLVVVAMSATLEAAPVARLLGDCPRITSEGRVHPVTVRHLPAPDDRPLPAQILSAIRTALREGPPGDLLVFVPGAAEIRATIEAAAPLAAEAGLELVPLHGELPIEEQARAVERRGRRKVVVSTNVAESSVTIEGITTVVDSGLARVAACSPWTGVVRLETRPVSRAAAAQRAGRAGRTAPGLVLRLYTRGDHDGRPAHDAPEITRADLADVLLLLHGAGIGDPGELAWLDPPPPAALRAAEELLAALGALDGERRLTAIGRRLVELGVHPRLGRVLIECERRGVASEGALAAAILGERDPRLEARARVDGGGRGRRIDGRGDSDVSAVADRLEAVGAARPDRLRREGLDPRTVAAITEVRRVLGRSVRDRRPRPADDEAVEAAVRYALLTGFPDRVARRRRPGEPALILASGDPARLGPASVVHDAPLLVALDADAPAGAGRGGIVVRLASAIDPDWLLDLPGTTLIESVEHTWNTDAERVDRITRLAYGSVTLDEARGRAPPSPEAAAVLARAARGVAWEAEALEGLAARLSLVAAHAPELGAALGGAPTTDALLDASCAEATSFAELRARPLVERLLAALPPAARRALDELAPTELRLPGGRRLRVQYRPGQPPSAATRLQDCFGLLATPTVCRGRLPVTLHLLAPNQRAVQVTADLAGFWERHYPAVRRELMRRYPKHAWPEDGARATPSAPRGKAR